MSSQIEQHPRRILEFAERWWQARLQELSRCRECGGDSHMLESICPHCGASHPVKVSVSAAVVLTAIAVALALIGIWVL